MTSSGLIMMIATWAIVGSFTLYFFFKVLRKPLDQDDSHQ
jgi:hypothetical protein